MEGNQNINNNQQGTTDVNNNQVNNYNVQPQQPVQPVQPQVYGYQQVNNPQVNNYSQFNNGMINNNPPKKKNTLNIILIILIVVIAGIIVIGLSKSKKNVGPHEHTDYDRTIMIYMAGADLESKLGLATLDLNGIDYSSMEAQKTKVIVIAGGSENWNNNYIDINSTSVYELTNNGYKVVKQQSKQNMGEAELLSDFLNYGFNNYKSKKYDLLFWNHGLGILGSEQDEFTKDHLTLAEIKNALKKSSFSKDNKLELVLFRTCLNGTIEVADTLKEYANYMVASQETTMGYTGDNFLKVLNNVSNSDDGKQMGTKFAKGYMEYINNYSKRNSYYSNSVYSTYSVLDLSKIDILESSLEDFFSSINLSSDYYQISRVRASLKQYGSEDLTYDSIDLYNLVNNLSSLSPDKAKKVLSDFDKVVIYNTATDSRSKGLSIYFPYNGASQYKDIILNDYYDFSGLTKYKSFITSFNSYTSKGAGSVSFGTNKVELETKKSESDFTLELDDDQKNKVAKAGYIVFRDNNDGTYLPVYSSINTTIEDNKINASIKDRQLKVIDKSDKTENIITLIEVEDTDDYIKYETYGVLENMKSSDIKDWLFQSAKITLILDKKTNKVSLGSVFVRPENTKENKNKSKEEIAKLPYNAAVNVEDYQYIAFGSSSYKILDSKGEYNEDWTSNGTYKGLELAPKNMEFKLLDYSDKYDYYAVFKIWDINNKVSYSKLVKMK